ncbi:hypothetical protein SLEP1_g38229 [Rubroshorea leprosula]|uniref:Uncharacterized protein n=1 Tax=Rubroshorea leprosula TaxID=152421 RepID=A0AAV5KXR8_9ROSI|nr:hypothetical protein SLEP1_g38229 [Rubroshorea leprosula]
MILVLSLGFGSCLVFAIGFQEAVKEAIERVLLWEKVIDQYCRPDRITAKKQQEELEKVAKNIPNSAPASVKQSANRLVLSLQSNPG